MLCRAEVDWDEGQPDDAGGVHGEADELGLVEGLGDLAGKDSVHGADDDKQDGVGEGDHVAGIDGGLKIKKKHDCKKWLTFCHALFHMENW